MRGTEDELCQIELPGGALFSKRSKLAKQTEHGKAGKSKAGAKFQVWFLHKTSI